MANRTASSSVLLVALCLLVLVATEAEARLVATEAEARQPRLVPAAFVFGDSTVDVGTNNDLNVTVAARANYPQYGIDFPKSKPTGRFSNGLNTADLLARGLGFKASPPAYLSLTTEKAIESQMYKGFNFASGGSGLSVRTGKSLGDVIPMPQQLRQFAGVVERMVKLAGTTKTATLLRRSIFFISAGSNDMFEYSVSPGNDTEFLGGLTAAYKDYIMALYRMGARKFSVIGIPPLGCIPSQRLRRLKQQGTPGCFDPLNDLSLGSYPMLAGMLQQLSYELPDMAYSFANTYAMVNFVFQNPQTEAWNFTDLEAACCGGGPYGAAFPCNESALVCANRDTYLFWDANHPTQAVSAIAAQTIFAGNQTFVSPVNVRELAML